MEGDGAETHFAQKLASNNKKIRDRALKRLHKYLALKSSHGGGLSDDDLLKIWKGLFYCMWMQDKPLIQEELSKRITSLIGAFPKSKDALKFVKVFLATHAREWQGIDHLRLDKFMMMIREMLQRTFSLLSEKGWKLKDCRMFSQLLAEAVMRPMETRLPDGLRLHIADIFVDELKKVSLSELTTSALVALVLPFMTYIVFSPKIELVRRILACVIDELAAMCLKKNSKKDEEEEDKEEEENAEEEVVEEEMDVSEQQTDLKADFYVLLAVMFRMSQKSEVRAQNRAAVYNLVRQHHQVLNRVDDAEVQSFLDDGQAMDPGGDPPQQKKKNKKRKFKNKGQEENMDVENNSLDNSHVQIETNASQQLTNNTSVPKKKKKSKLLLEGEDDIDGNNADTTKKKSGTATQHSDDSFNCGDYVVDSSSTKKRKKRNRSEEISPIDMAGGDAPVHKKIKKQKIKKTNCEVSSEAAIPCKTKSPSSPNASKSDNSVKVSLKNKDKKNMKKSKSANFLGDATADQSQTLLSLNKNSNAKPSKLKAESVEMVVYTQKSVEPASMTETETSESNSILTLDGDIEAKADSPIHDNKMAQGEGGGIFSTPNRLKKALVMKATALCGKSPAEANPAGHPAGDPDTPGKKKVIFDLKRNRANKFKDYIKSLKSPVTPPPFDPTPIQGILKPPTPQLGKKIKTTVSRRLSESPKKKSPKNKVYRSRSTSLSRK